MSPPTERPGQGPQGQSSADDEAKRKEQAAKMAMMDDLGLARVAELPLDEGGRNRGRDHDRRVRNGGDVRMPLPAPPPSQVVQRAPPRGNAGASSWTFGQAWQDAIASGAFDDDDAEGVKGLDDLGGGRIYDRAANKTMMILDQRSKRTGRQIEYPVPKKKARPNDSGANIHDRLVAARRQAANQTRAPSSQASASSAKSKKTKPPKLTPTSRSARRLPPPPRDVPSLGVPVPDMVVDLSTPLPYEPENAILRVPVRFSSRDITPAQPALIVLSSANRPELGFFTVFIYNRPFCQWPISVWHDYATGVDHLLGVTFLNAGSFQGYELYFANDNDLREFMSRVRALMAGDYLDQGDSAPPASTAQSTLISNPTVAAAPVVASAPAMASSIGTPGPQNRLPQPPAPNDVAPSTQTTNGAASTSEPVLERVHSPVLNDTPTSATVNANAPSYNTTISGSIQESSQVEPIGEPEQEDLLEFEPNDTSTVTSQIGSEDTGFLFREDAMDMARTVFFVMMTRYPGTGTMTMAGWDEVAEGVRAGVIEHMVKNARERGLSDQRIQALRDTVNEALESEIKVNRRSRQGVTSGDIDSQPRVNGIAQPEPPASTRTGRIQYSAEELLSLRHAAADPSDRLANIPYLPRPGERPPQPDTLPRRPGSPAGPAISQTQVLKSAGAMDWVLGKANAQPTPEPSSSTQTASVAASNAARPSAPQDVGLQSSRWATGGPELKAANAFTGPKYEKAWSKRSYLEDLAQLDPQTRVTAAAEDLMDLYFPLPNDGSSEPQTSDQDIQEPAVAGAESGAATPTRSDKIENLRLGISRLSIWSPTSAPQRPAWTPAPVQPSSPVVQASRNLWSQATSTGSAQQANAPAAQPTSVVLTPPASTPVVQAIPSSSQPSSSPSARPGGISSSVRPQVAPPQSVPTVSAQSTASPVQARMASMHAAPSSPLASSFGSVSAGSVRVAPLQSVSESATQSTTSPRQARMTSIHAAPSSVPVQSGALTQVASPQHMPTAVPTQPRMASPSAARSSVTTQSSASTGVLSPRMVQPQATAVTAPRPGPQAAQPKPRGLAASRHASGDGPSSSGNFKFVVPK